MLLPVQLLANPRQHYWIVEYLLPVVPTLSDCITECSNPSVLGFRVRYVGTRYLRELPGACVILPIICIYLKMMSTMTVKPMKADETIHDMV